MRKTVTAAGKGAVVTTLHAKAARIIEAVVGLYYLAGALPKVADINRFSVQMSAYHVIEDRQLLPVFGCVTIFAEFAVGIVLQFPGK